MLSDVQEVGFQGGRRSGGPLGATPNSNLSNLDKHQLCVHGAGEIVQFALDAPGCAAAAGRMIDIVKLSAIDDIGPPLY